MGSFRGKIGRDFWRLRADRPWSEQIEAAKENLARIVQMLMGMLRRFSERSEFLREDEGGYGIEHEHEHEHEHEDEGETG
jgi:hypothetical protein